MDAVRDIVARNGERFQLRPAEPGDCNEIVKTIRSSSSERSYVLTEMYGMSPDAIEEYICALDQERNLLLVAVTGDHVVGSLAALQAYGGTRPESSHILHVGLHILEGYRGIGIGTHMLEFAVEWARDRGYKKVSASIFTSNKKSLNLFSHAGFSEECVRHKHIRMGREYIDEICMVKFVE